MSQFESRSQPKREPLKPAAPTGPTVPTTSAAQEKDLISKASKLSLDVAKKQSVAKAAPIKEVSISPEKSTDTVVIRPSESAQPKVDQSVALSTAEDISKLNEITNTIKGMISAHPVGGKNSEVQKYDDRKEYITAERETRKKVVANLVATKAQQGLEKDPTQIQQQQKNAATPELNKDGADLADRTAGKKETELGTKRPDSIVQEMTLPVLERIRLHDPSAQIDLARSGAADTMQSGLSERNSSRRLDAALQTQDLVRDRTDPTGLAKDPIGLAKEKVERELAALKSELPSEVRKELESKVLVSDQARIAIELELIRVAGRAKTETSSIFDPIEFSKTPERDQSYSAFEVHRVGDQKDVEEEEEEEFLLTSGTEIRKTVRKKMFRRAVRESRRLNKKMTPRERRLAAAKLNRKRRVRKKKKKSRSRLLFT